MGNTNKKATIQATIQARLFNQVGRLSNGLRLSSGKEAPSFFLFKSKKKKKKPQVIKNKV